MSDIINEATNVQGNQNVIGDTATVRFTSLPGSGALKAKVDTGADLCSLHAEKWVINNNKVHFNCPKLSPNTLSLPLRDHQTVKSASGTQYRPVVELNIKVNDKLLSNIMFNITDRTGMDYPVLLGRNALEKGRFLIDPSLAEQIEMDKPPLDASVKEPDMEDVVDDAEATAPEQTGDLGDDKLKQIYDLMKDSDITFSDLIKYIRTQVTKTFEDIKY